MSEKEEVVEKLKIKWLNDNNFTKPMAQECFFCEYDKQQENTCEKCPARLVESGFHCDDMGQSFRYDPIKFYIRLLELYIKWKD